MLVDLRGTPIWRPENSVNIWNLLWLSRRLIISTDQTSIYISTSPNALTSKKAQNHGMYGLLTKCEVKMAGYWPISSHLDRTNLVNKGFIIWLSRKFFLRDTAGSPERAR